jgi:cytochrome c oxidase subunit IV
LNAAGGKPPPDFLPQQRAELVAYQPVEDTARLTERRQTVTNIYVAVNTILLSAVALLVKDAGLQRWVVAAATLMVLVAGIVICLFWRQLIIRYKKLVGLRIDELRKMEDLPEMAGCQGMYHVEDKLYPRDAQGNMLKVKGRMDFSDLERQLPNVFIVLYVLFLVGIVIAALTGAIWKRLSGKHSVLTRRLTGELILTRQNRVCTETTSLRITLPCQKARYGFSVRISCLAIHPSR